MYRSLLRLELCLLLLGPWLLFVGGRCFFQVLEARLASQFGATALGVANHTTFPARALDPFAGSLGRFAFAWLAPEVAL